MPTISAFALFASRASVHKLVLLVPRSTLIPSYYRNLSRCWRDLACGGPLRCTLFDYRCIQWWLNGIHYISVFVLFFFFSQKNKSMGKQVQRSVTQVIYVNKNRLYAYTTFPTWRLQRACTHVFTIACTVWLKVPYAIVHAFSHHVFSLLTRSLNVLEADNYRLRFARHFAYICLKIIVCSLMRARI